MTEGMREHAWPTKNFTTDRELHTNDSHRIRCFYIAYSSLARQGGSRRQPSTDPCPAFAGSRAFQSKNLIRDLSENRPMMPCMDDRSVRAFEVQAPRPSGPSRRRVEA